MAPDAEADTRASATGAALIGDVIRSREHPDQVRLLADLEQLLERVNGLVALRQPLALTAGDGFQGFSESLESALRVTTLLHLECPPGLDLRLGLGWGEIVIKDAEQVPVGQSGAAWWRARDAIDFVAGQAARKKWPRSLRTWFLGDDERHGHAVQAFLVCRDQVLGQMDVKDRRIALGLFRGEKQIELAGDLDMTQPQVSKHQIENGPAALFQAHEAFDGELRGGTSR